MIDGMIRRHKKALADMAGAFVIYKASVPIFRYGLNSDRKGGMMI